MRSAADVTGRLRDRTESLLSPLSPLKPGATPLRPYASAADQATVVGS
jgi:hypothetical protein